MPPCRVPCHGVKHILCRVSRPRRGNPYITRRPPPPTFFPGTVGFRPGQSSSSNRAALAARLGWSWPFGSRLDSRRHGREERANLATLAGDGTADRPELFEREGAGARWLSHFMKPGRQWRYGGVKSMPESSRRQSASSMPTGRADEPKVAPMMKSCADGSTANSAGLTCGAGSASGYTCECGVVGLVGPRSRRWRVPCPPLLRLRAMTGPHEADQGSATCWPSSLLRKMPGRNHVPRSPSRTGLYRLRMRPSFFHIDKKGSRGTSRVVLGAFHASYLPEIIRTRFLK
jgi:hypothetical protein